MNVIEFISQPWPWYVGGPLIALTMFLLLYFGKEFGVSSNLRTLCAIGGGGKFSEFFRYDWKSQIWNLVFVIGTVIGGYVASNWLTDPQAIQLNPSTVSALSEMGIANAGSSYVPEEIFTWQGLTTSRGFIMIVIGGFFVGFGSRYAGGCTSGHAISGMSNLQLPSLVTVIGFFIGGLIVTHLILPIILAL